MSEEIKKRIESLTEKMNQTNSIHGVVALSFMAGLEIGELTEKEKQVAKDGEDHRKN